MRRAVVDASVAVDALLPSPHQAGALAHLTETDPLAPALIDTEVLSAVARLERAGMLHGSQADAAVAAWTDAPVERVRRNSSPGESGRCVTPSGSPTPTTWRSHSHSTSRSSPATAGSRGPLFPGLAVLYVPRA